MVAADEVELDHVALGGGDGVGREGQAALADEHLDVGGGSASRQGEDGRDEHVCQRASGQKSGWLRGIEKVPRFQPA